MEIWKDIKGYEGLYQVSDLGRVKRIISKYSPKEKILKTPIKSGYYYATLSKNGIRHKVYFHQLVAYTFICESNLVIDHVDGNKLNNKLDNLEFVTHRQNAQRYRSTKKHSSAYMGVRFKKYKWYAQITIKGKPVHLGVFEDEKKASEAYQSALKKLKENEHNKQHTKIR